MTKTSDLPFLSLTLGMVVPTTSIAMSRRGAADEGALEGGSQENAAVYDVLAEMFQGMDVKA